MENHQDNTPHSFTTYYGSIDDEWSAASSTVASSSSSSLSCLSSIHNDEPPKYTSGYANKQASPELKKSLSAFTTFGLAFSNIGIFANTSATFQTVLQRGGPVSALLGWNIVAIMAIAISLSLAEICSVFHTSGGLYVWVYELLNRHPKAKKHAAFVSVATGFLYTMSLIIGIAATDVSIALSAGSLLKIITGHGLSHTMVLCLTLVIVMSQAVLNGRHTHLLNVLNKLNVFWSCAGLILVVIVLSFFVKDHQDPVWVFTHYENETGFDSPYYVFVLGMIGAAYSMSGSESSASMSEETENAAMASPIAMVTSIITAWIFGFIYLLALLFSIQDMDAVLNTTFNLPVAQVFIDAVGRSVTIGFLILMVVCQYSSGSAALTVSSRMVYAMARDGGTPYHRQLSQLNDQQIPGNAVFATFLLAVGVVLPYPLSDHLFVVIISAATITIYSTYAVALGCKLFMGMGGKKGPFQLGPFSKPITALAFAWSLFTVVAFTLPTSWPIDAANTNYAGPALCVLMLITYCMLSFTSLSTDEL
ncbi:hypothetical protein [Absidia glauca]|uniref:Amino acid permease/ SLC12A domain-containing protein n=1 Tax=Absidia glauca TaxID=4829 RepID=A0A163JU91_ABSGL|nr:hypothetical protein [Absidia glauca]